MESVYLVRHAVSEDGLIWQRDDGYMIDKLYEDECQLPSNVVSFAGEYHMFFSYRHSVNFRNGERGYRIGHAVSKDLKIWKRDYEFNGFPCSSTGWDSEMVCYPNIIKMKDGRILVFYCGNHFGKGGMGYAEIEY